MGGPWEKYSKTANPSTETAEGPWSKYSKKTAEPKKDNSFNKEAALEGFGEGATLGYLNNLQAMTEPAMFKALNFLTGQNVEADDYTRARDSYNKRQEQLKKESPKSFGTGQVAGTVVSSIPVARAAQAATVLGRAAQAAKAGAVYGAAQNTDETAGELGGLDLGERIVNAGTGAALGAGASVGADGLVKVGSGVMRGVSNLKNKVGNSLKKTAEELAENATGATRVQAEKYSDDAGRYLLDNKIVAAGDTAEDIARKSKEAIKKSEDTIDSSLKSLDEKGVKVSQDKIVETLQSKIKELEKDSSKADVVRNLKGIVDDIINTGESQVSVSAAETTKRGYSTNSNMWNNPKGSAGQQADKISYRVHRDAVEEAAEAADKNIAGQFKDAKQTYGKLNPIANASEKRAEQLKQFPIGGLLDTAAVIGGSVNGNDPLSGGAMGIAAALARRKIAPRVGSTLAVSFDKVSKQLLKNPQMVEIAKKSPEEFTNLVFSTLQKTQGDNLGGVIQSVAGISPNKGPNKFASDGATPNITDFQKKEKGPEKWMREGASKIREHNPEISQETLQKLMSSKRGQDLLMQASDLKPGSKAMENIIQRMNSEGN